MKTYIIAEAGVNHNGSLQLAKELVKVAAEAGANAVKFQTFKADKLVSRHAQKAEYQKATTAPNESQLEMISRLELSQEAHLELVELCEKLEIDFLSSPFDLESLNFLSAQLNLQTIKLGSGELTNAPLLLATAQKKCKIILSTGMSTLAEIERALGVLAYGFLNPESVPTSVRDFEEAYFSDIGQRTLDEKVLLMHCTTEYPTPFQDVNLRAIATLQSAFKLSVGFSDHTQGIAVPVAAVALGAIAIEKHFTLDRSLPGPDHQASLEPAELKQLVVSIRQIEEALGDGLKKPTESELKNKAVARKSLVAAAPIKKGEAFTVHNLTVKRPGDGIEPFRFWEFLKRQAEKDYVSDEVLDG